MQALAEEKKRILYLDFGRIAAIIAVVTLHSCASFITQSDNTSSDFFWGNIWDSLARYGVPLFVMISGALMLDENKNKTVKSLVYKNVKNIVVLFFIWSSIYCIFTRYSSLLNLEQISVVDLVASLFVGYFHMWYLYLIIGLYLITPFLRMFVKKENSDLVLLFLALALITQFTEPILSGLTLIYDKMSYFENLRGKLHLDFFGGFTAYYLAGWYIVHIGVNKSWVKHGLYFASFLSLAITATYTYTTKDFYNGYSNTNAFIFIYSVGIFLAISNLKFKFGVKTQNIVVLLSKLTFGVYIVHPMIQQVLFEYISVQNPNVCILERSIASLALSFAVCYLISKIPVIKKIIRC